MKIKTKLTLNVTTGALFLALGILFPMVFHTVAKAGAILCPMHVPVLLCGFVCGPLIGGVVGLLTPLLSSVITGMPPIYPVATSMMFELAAYGVVSGILYRLFRKKGKLKRFSILLALVGAMLFGRLVGGAASAIFYLSIGWTYTFEIFLTAAFVTALPGIVLQFLIIPSAVFALEKANVLQKYEIDFRGKGGADRDGKNVVRGVAAEEISAAQDARG